MAKGYSPLKPTPDKIKPLLELADMLEPKQTLPVFSDVLALVESRWSDEDELQEYARAHKIDMRDAELCLWVEGAFRASIAVQQKVKALNEGLAKTSSQFKEYVWGDPYEHLDDPRTRVAYAVERYEESRVALMQLQHLASFPKPALCNVERFRFSQRSFDAAGTLTIDAQGRVIFKDSLFRRAVEGVEVDRIRECKICGRAFWAGRSTKLCCSDRCSDTFRVRRFRYKTSAEKKAYNRQRNKRKREREAASRDSAQPRAKKGK